MHCIIATTSIQFLHSKESIMHCSPHDQLLSWGRKGQVKATTYIVCKLDYPTSEQVPWARMTTFGSKCDCKLCHLLQAASLLLLTVTVTVDKCEIVNFLLHVASNNWSLAATSVRKHVDMGWLVYICLTSAKITLLQGGGSSSIHKAVDVLWVT